MKGLILSHNNLNYHYWFKRPLGPKITTASVANKIISHGVRCYHLTHTKPRVETLSELWLGRNKTSYCLSSDCARCDLILISFMKAIISLLLISSLASCTDPCESTIRQELMNDEYWQSYQGTIKGKFIDHNDRDNPKIYLDNKVILFENCYVFDSLQVNDILIKNKYTLKYLLVRHNTGDTISYYPTCGGRIMKDN